ncbi:MAG: hypothetical protein PHG00_11700 [Methylococcales bacterium]|nr:hypothetical protein [Methylococcales bacterium]
MNTNELPRHKLIKSLMAQEAEAIVDNAIDLWERLAIQVTAIIGKNGFTSLYERSVFLVQPTFPWLAPGPQLSKSDHRFEELKTYLEGQNPAQAHEANSQLMITFTDILASLIGEQLMIRILRAAWGDSVWDNSVEVSKNA